MSTNNDSYFMARLRQTTAEETPGPQKHFDSSARRAQDINVRSESEADSTGGFSKPHSIDSLELAYQHREVHLLKVVQRWRDEVIQNLRS
ncbi:hypothetical protein GJAV_G00080390, partial [Gymnothorax javanicus]